MSHAKFITTAQQNLIATRALCDVLAAEIARDFPTPPIGVDEATFEVWNEAIGQAEIDRGVYKAADAKRAAEDALIASVGTWLQSLRRPRREVLELIDMLPKRYAAREKCIALFMKLDTSTLHMIEG